MAYASVHTPLHGRAGKDLLVPTSQTQAQTQPFSFFSSLMRSPGVQARTCWCPQSDTSSNTTFLLLFLTDALPRRAGKDLLVPALKLPHNFHHSPLLGNPPYRRDILLFFRSVRMRSARVRRGPCPASAAAVLPPRSLRAGGLCALCTRPSRQREEAG